MNEKELVNAELARLHELYLKLDPSDATWVKEKIDFIYDNWLTPKFLIPRNSDNMERLPF